MREIKFRAWDKDKNRFIEIDKSNGFNLSVHSDGVKAVSIWHDPKYPKTLRTDELDWKLMQFTGLLDKNAKEIYEGDIVECYDTDGNSVYVDGHVIELPNFYREIWSNDEDGMSAEMGEKAVVKIIGNVHENPELLHD